MNVSFDYYKIFYCVGKHKSFTKAAEELFIGQPNVTRAIKSLEGQLGCALFVRSKRKVEFTDEGEKLFCHIQIACEHIRLGEEELALCKQLQGGTVTIGATETALYGLLLPVLKKFHEAHPKIKLKIGNYTVKEALAALTNGLSDLAVVTSPLHANEKLTVTALKRFREVAVCGSDFPELTQAPVGLNALRAYPLVGLARNTITHEFYSAQFAAYGLEYNPDIEVATADQLLPVIENNLCVGFVPEFFLNAKSNVHAINIAERLPSREICLVKRAGSQLSLAAAELEKEIMQFGARKETVSGL